jgi:hypothetical protein
VVVDGQFKIKPGSKVIDVAKAQAAASGKSPARP